MEEGEKFFEIGVSRHAPKVEKAGDVIDVRKQGVDREEAMKSIELPVRSFLENIEKAPEGTVMAFEPSNVDRADQTRELFVESLKKILGNRDDIKMIELSEDQEETESKLKEIKDNPKKKYIITNIRGSWLLGFKEDDAQVPAINKWKNRLKGNEDFIGKMYSAHPDEIAALHKELNDAGFDVKEEEINPGEFKMPPEQGALRQIKWMREMKKIGEKYFPDRTMILEGVSHNMRSDFAILALLDEDISLESVNRILKGKFRDFYERSSVLFNSDGGVEIRFRDVYKKYSQEEFKRVLENIRTRMENRKEEWDSGSV